MRISISLVLGALVAGSTAASAQSLIVIAMCDHIGPAGPTHSHVQASEAVGTFCTDLTPENRDFCLGAEEVSSRAGTGLACAEAIRDVESFGLEEAFLDAVAPSAARGTHEATHAFQNNQTHLQFSMERASGAVDLVGCSLAGDGPGATYVQNPDASDSDARDLSCADAIQASVNAGAALSSNGSVVIGDTARSAITMQQGRLALDGDFNEGKPAEFVIVRVGQWSMAAD